MIGLVKSKNDVGMGMFFKLVIIIEICRIIVRYF